MVPRVFRAPEGPAAREVRRPHFVRRRASKPGQAPQASCPALAHIAAESTPNFARNSPATLSNSEFRSLELQRFQTLLKLRPIELRARFRGSCSCRPAISHAIPLNVFHGLKSDRWNSAESTLVRGWAELELHAELWDGSSSPRWRLSLRGIALLGQALHCLVASAMLCYLVHWSCI